MRTLTKITIITIAAVLMLAMTVSMLATADAVFVKLIVLDSEERLTAIDDDNYDIDTQKSSLRVTQSTKDGLEVECEGNLKCEILGDDAIVVSSDPDTTTAAAVSNALNQSNVIQYGNDFDVIDEKDLGAMIDGMVDLLLDDLFA
jgi:hypothetical protein